LWFKEGLKQWLNAPEIIGIGLVALDIAENIMNVLKEILGIVKKVG
tara:strand:- start:3331 stop:3468 length:138 start_codon:yes stop_codon:yes gene_type:complete